jgi:energy-coupling factor transporter ATP-binding protein EcfA2
MNPEVLLLDEPTAGLDPMAAASMEQVLLSLQDGGLSMITATHDVNQALKLAQRLLVFQKGRVVWDGQGDLFFRTQNPDALGLELPLSGRMGKILGLSPLPVIPTELLAVLGAVARSGVSGGRG